MSDQNQSAGQHRDRTVVLTGAASPRGIGRATAHHLAEAGWDVGIIDLDQTASEQVAAEIREQHGVRAVGVGANVADESAVRAAFDTIEAELRPITALVNLAGVSSAHAYLDLPEGSGTGCCRSTSTVCTSPACGRRSRWCGPATGAS